MNIAVFVKQVPDTSDVQLDSKTGNLKRESAAAIINPVDMNVLEVALSLKDKHDCTVSAISMGPPQAEAVLRKALSLGCDAAYLLCDRAFAGADTLATAYTLSSAVKKLGGFDLLLFGRRSSDGDTAQVGPATAAFLNIPHVSLCTAVEIDDKNAYCTRDLQDGVERIRIGLPAVAAINENVNQPRIPSMFNILEAVNKTITVWGAEDIRADLNKTGLAGSPSVTKELLAAPCGKVNATMLYGDVNEIAAKLADILEAEQII